MMMSTVSELAMELFRENLEKIIASYCIIIIYITRAICGKKRL